MPKRFAVSGNKVLAGAKIGHLLICTSFNGTDETPLSSNSDFLVYKSVRNSSALLANKLSILPVKSQTMSAF